MPHWLTLSNHLEMNKNPSKYLLQFFRWFCNPDFAEDIEGDLLERYQKKPSNLILAFEIFKLIRPSIVRNFEGTQKLNNYGMLKNNLKIAWRSAVRQKQFTVINLAGLTLGIATCIAISLYIYDELSYDTFHENGDRIVRVNQPKIWSDWSELSSATGPNVAVALRAEAPEFEQVTRLLSTGAQIVRPGRPEEQRSTFKERLFYAAEDNFFDVFTFDFIAGDRATVLAKPNSMILTMETAKRYFNETHSPDKLIGRKVQVKSWDGSWQSFSIGGIVKDVPDQSHLQFDILVSLSSYQEQMDRDGWKWIWTAFSTYGLLHEGTDLADLERKIQGIPPKWAPPTTERIFNQSFEDFTAGYPWRLDLQPLSDIYRAGDPDFHYFGKTGNPLFVKMFGAIAVLVLILSAINFMNLSTARSSTRAKEIGVRKVLGSERNQLISQFTFESILYVSISTLLAIILVGISLEWFNTITFKEMTLDLFIAQPVSVVILLAFILLLGVFAGCYPAIYLSAMKPINALKGGSTKVFKGKSLRNVLVVFQFSISIALIICASFVQKQMSYASSLDLGFEKENILQVHNIEQFGFDTEVVKARLSSNSEITQIGKSFGIPPDIWSGDRYKAAGDEKVIQFSNVRAEEDFISLLGVEFLAGRNFDSSRPTDKYKVVINETATKILGWGDRTSYSEDSPIGKKIALASGDEDQFEVIGVMKDFHFNSIKREIRPLIIIHHQNDRVWDYGAGRSFYSLKLDPESIRTTEDLTRFIAKIESDLEAIDPAVPFEFSFLDQDFDAIFRFEQRMSLGINLFTVLALIIGCLGLFGLAAFSAEQRTKELSIRKVLGASLTELLVKFSSEFTKLVGISILIACPIAWYLVKLWLENFAYSTPVDLWIFLAAAVAAMLVALATVSLQSLKVARKNPAETLKDE